MLLTEYDEKKYMKYFKEEGREEGREEGEERVNTLIVLLAEQGRTEDIVKSAYDKEYQQKLFDEFGL